MQDQQYSGPIPGWYVDPLGRFEYRYWDGVAWTAHVVSSGRMGVDTRVVAQPAHAAVVTQPGTYSPQQQTPASVRTSQSALARPLDKGFVRRVFWCLYAMPVSLLMASASLSLLFPLKPATTVDAILTLFALVVMYLHIFDVRPRPRWLFRAASIIFIPWQLAYWFFLEPNAPGFSFDPSMLIGFVLTLPLFVALVRYSLRRWPAESNASSVPAPSAFAAATVGAPSASGRPKVRPGLAAAGIGVGFLGLLVLLLMGIGFVSSGGFEWVVRTAAGGMFTRPVYEVKARPPAVPLASSELSAQLTPEQAAALRSMLSSGDYAGLNREFALLQDLIDADPAAESKMLDAATLFSAQEYKESLDAWVAATPGAFAPHLVLAKYHYDAGWAARGHDWAKNTSREQFEAMGAAFSKALAECDVAERARPRLPQVATWRIAIANAASMDQEWRDIQRGLDEFPRSYAVHAIAVHAMLPRWGGSYSEMEKIADRGVAANPSDPRFVSLYSEIYADQADVYDRAWAADKAIAMYSRALSYEQDPDWLAARGWLYHDEEEPAKARADAEAGLRLDPSHEQCLLLKADVVYHQGDAQTSASLLAEAEKLYPDSETVAQIRDHLARSR